MNIIKKKSITDIDIYSLCDSLKLPLNAIIMRDQLNESTLEEGNYILNLNTSSEQGSHWTSFVVDKKTIYYLDSYGKVPPEEAVLLWNKNKYKVICNNAHIQDIASVECGFFAVYFLLVMNYGTGRTKTEVMKKCIKSFIIDDYKKDKNNDKLVKEYLKQFLKAKTKIIM
jgi:hypothetical protein